MKIIDYCNIPKGKIEVLGVKSDSAFIKLISKELKEVGTVEITDSFDINCTADYVLVILDEKSDKVFTAHNELSEDAFKIGVVNVNVFEKYVSDVINNTELFCKIADTDEKQLVYPFMLAKFIDKNEKYSFMFIDGVNTVSKRYLARELAKCLSMGVCIGSAIDGEIELLRKAD